MHGGKTITNSPKIRQYLDYCQYLEPQPNHDSTSQFRLKKLHPNTEQPNYDRGSITELSADSSTTTAPSANNSSGVFTRTSITRIIV